MGHVVKAKERAEVKRYGGRLHHLSFNRSLPQWGFTSNKSYLLLMSIIFCLSCCDAHFLSCSCSALSDFFIRLFFSFSFFEAWRRPPPAATEDNYTNTDKSASTVTHSRVGVLPYATSYHLQRLCKTEKKTVKSGAGHKGERCAESRRDPGWWKEKGGSDHLAHRASHLDTLRSEKITQVSLCFSHNIFFVLEVVVFYVVLFFSSSVALYKYIFDRWKFQAPLVFGWPTKSILFDFSTQKSLNKNILGKKCYSLNRAPLGSSQPSETTLYWIILLIFNDQAVSYPAHFSQLFPLPPPGLAYISGQLGSWAAADCVCICACVCFDRPSQWRHKIGSGKSQSETAPGVWIRSQNNVFQSWLCASYRGSNLGQGLQGFV